LYKYEQILKKKKYFAEIFKNLTRFENNYRFKKILLNYQNDYVENLRMRSNAAKKF